MAMANQTMIRAAFSAAQRRGAAIPANVTRKFSAILTPAEEFPGLPSVSPAPAKASTASVTKLSSGVTVVTEDASATSTVSLTFPYGGSSSETSSEIGASLVNRFITFKSGSGLSTALIIRNLEDDGASPFATSTRHSATIGYTAAPDKVERLVPLLVIDCAFEKWDIRDAAKAAKAEVEDAGKSAQAVLTEQIFAACYGPQSPLGKPYFMAGTNPDSIISFREKGYGLKGAVLAATGVSDHAAFVEAVDASFVSANPGPDTPPETVSPFIGGEARIWAPSSGYSHMAVALPTPPSASPALTHVIKVCLDILGGDGISAFEAPGIVGLYASGTSAVASSQSDAVISAIVSKPSAEIVSRAVALAKAEALFGLDGGSRSLAEAMTSSVMATGTFSAAAIGASYDAVTAKDVTAALASMVKANPAIAAIGDIAGVPYHSSLVASLK